MGINLYEEEIDTFLNNRKMFVCDGGFVQTRYIFIMFVNNMCLKNGIDCVALWYNNLFLFDHLIDEIY